jgi:predicted acetyltransferase
MQLRTLCGEERRKAANLWEYCFHDGLAFARWYVERKADAILALGEDELIAMMATVNVGISVRGERRPARVVAGVSTAPAHRKQSAMHTMLPQSYATMHEQGAVLASLYPFDYGFYRRFGWASCGEVIKVRAPLTRLPVRRFAGRFHMIEQLPSCEEDFVAAYTACFSRYSGHVIRDANAFTRRLEEVALDEGYAAFYERAGQMEGYLLYHIEGRTLVVDEMGAATRDARLDLLSFLALHASSQEDVTWIAPADDPMWRLLPDGRGTASLEPYAMMRILDIEGMFCGLAAGEGSTCLRVVDEHAPWIDGCWRFLGEGGRMRAERVSQTQDAPRVSIGALTQWALGYKSAGDLAQSGEIEEGQHIEAMDQLLQKRPVFIYEMY